MASLNSINKCGAPDWLGMQANSQPNNPFLLYKNSAYTFQQVNLLVSKVCQLWILRRDSADTAPFGILATDPLLTCLLVLTAVRLDRPVVVLNQRLSDTQLQDQCSLLNLRLVFVDSNEPLQHDRSLGVGCVKSQVSISAFSCLSDGCAAVSSKAFQGDLRALQGFVFTSGTTGVHKAVQLTFANHYWSAVGSAYRLGYSTDDRWLHCMPFSHVGGLALLFRALLFGFSLQLVNKFSVEEVLNTILHGNATLASFVPTMLIRLLDSNLCIRNQPVPFRFALVGGSKVPAALLEKCKSQGIEIVPSYGMTETCTHIASAYPHGANANTGEGVPLPFVQISIRKVAGQDMPGQATGEIWVRGPQVSQEQTDSQGWLQTGDYGYFDMEGRLHVLGRSQDVFQIGGETVDSSNTLSVLRLFPGVQDCWVVGLPDREWGHELIALIVPHIGAQIHVDDLKMHCRERLSALQTPKVFLMAKAIPRSLSGKVLRDQARALVETGKL